MSDSLFSWPLLDRLSKSSNILLAGAGGGFDVYSALPLYFALKSKGKEVHLANLSFARLPFQIKKNRVSSACFKVTADTPYSKTYFPEFHLSLWFREHLNQEVPVYAIRRTGVIPVSAAYRRLKKRLNFDAIVLVDGGTDSLMRGDEFDLATPGEDITSISAVAALEGVEQKLLACIGFGVDHFHGICHAHFLEAVASLAKENAFLGVTSVLPDLDETKLFSSALAFANSQTTDRESIVANSILSAINGDYGNIHSTQRTKGSKLWINPLMSMYWGFELLPIFERNLYAKSLAKTETYSEVMHIISAFRARCEVKQWESIPV